MIFPIEIYKEGEHLGRGSYGNVTRYDRKEHFSNPRLNDGTPLPSSVAVKQTSQSIQDRNYDDMRESEIMRALEHPHIVKYYGVFSDDVGHNIVMELCDTTLAHWMRGRAESLRPWEMAVIMMQVLWGLSYLHGKNIIHRDLKPSNILLRHKSNKRDFGLLDLVVKLADFNLSREVNTGSMTPIGTIRYMAPEIKVAFDVGSSRATYDCRADCYSSGKIALEMLPGNFTLPLGEKFTLPNLAEALNLSCDSELLTFLYHQLHPDYSKRLHAKDLLKLPFITNLERDQEYQEAKRQSLSASSAIESGVKGHVSKNGTHEEPSAFGAASSGYATATPLSESIISISSLEQLIGRQVDLKSGELKDFFAFSHHHIMTADEDDAVVPHPAFRGRWKSPAVLNDGFKADLRKLPRTFSEAKLDNFARFFSIHGHGFVTKVEHGRKIVSDSSVSSAKSSTTSSTLILTLDPPAGVMRYDEFFKEIGREKLATATKAALDLLVDHVSNEKDGQICDLCRDKKKDTVILPCGHANVCWDCANRCRAKDPPLCPSCRDPIENIKRLFGMD